MSSEGENVREGSEAISQQAPGSNPGSDDSTGGIATGSGGVSSAAYVDSPVPSEQKSVVQTTVDTVKSYLSGLSLGGSNTGGQEGESATGGESTSTGGYVAAASGAAAAAASYVGITNAASTDSADPSASATAKDVDMTDTEPKGELGKTDESNQVSQATRDRYAPGESDGAVTDTTNETNKAAADQWAPGEKENTTGGTVTDTTNETGKVASDNWTPGGKETTTGGSTTDTGNEERKVAGDNWTPDQKEGTTGGDTTTSDTSDQKDETSGGDTSTSDAPKKTTGGTGTRENPDAIPTAGGERLGEKHWGESKIVPDIPKTQDESQVSSAEGQPDKATKDNTAQNTGGAAPPSSSADDGGQEKLSMKDKIKDKLNIGSKDK